MKLTSSRTLRLSIAGALIVALAGGALFFGVLRTAAAPQAQEPVPIEVFCAPSHLPSGDHWAILGSRDVFPEDFAVTSTQVDVAVVEVQRLSDHALAVRLQVGATATGSLIHARSVEGGVDSDLPVFRGQTVPELSSAENFGPESFTDGWLLVKTDRFLYGYLPATDGGIAAVRIHNRRSGRWARREHAEELGIAQREEENAEPLPPGFSEVDPLETLPDTDGDGIYDFEEEPEPEEPVPEFLGVELAPGENLLDMVVYDDYGNASWGLLQVFSTWSPPEPQS